MDQNLQTAAEVSSLGLDKQPASSPTGTPTGTPASGEKKVGPIIAILVIVLVLIIITLYLFASRINQPAIPDDTTPTSDAAVPTDLSATVQVQPITGTATDVSSLQNDLNNSTKGLDGQNF